jgi:hypothetical protein
MQHSDGRLFRILAVRSHDLAISGVALGNSEIKLGDRSRFSGFNVASGQGGSSVRTYVSKGVTYLYHHTCSVDGNDEK